VYTQACPLFVPLAEEAFLDHPATKLIAEEYLSSLKATSIDTLILGCTHYPLLKNVIQQTVAEKITIIDSAVPTARAVRELLLTQNLLRAAAPPNYKFYVTNTPELGQKSAELFFGDGHNIQLEKIIL
jgi:glutamate racemase